MNVSHFRLMLGANIRHRRTLLNLRQYEVAALAGKRPSEISQAETGAHSLKAETLVAIARALQTTPDALLAFALDTEAAA